MRFTEFLPYLLVMAVVTYLVRAIPFATIRGKVKSRFFCSFLYYIPYAVLSAMTFPAILESTTYFLSALVGTLVALVLAYFKQSLIKVAMAACLAVYITELIIGLV